MNEKNRFKHHDRIPSDAKGLLISGSRVVDKECS